MGRYGEIWGDMGRLPLLVPRPERRNQVASRREAHCHDRPGPEAAEERDRVLRVAREAVFDLV